MLYETGERGTSDNRGTNEKETEKGKKKKEFRITQERGYVKRLQNCNLCNLFATPKQPFKKHLNKSKTLIQCGFTACIFTFATFATYFRGSLYIEKTFFIFYFHTQPLKTGCKGCKCKYAPYKLHNGGLFSPFTQKMKSCKLVANRLQRLQKRLQKRLQPLQHSQDSFLVLYETGARGTRDNRGTNEKET